MLLERRRSALLLIDLQERLVPAMDGAGHVAERAGVLLEGARRLDLPVLATRQYPRGLGDLVPPLAEALPAEAVHDKMSFSAHRDKALAAAMAGLGRDQFVLAGVEAHVCVLQTALDLCSEGYAVTVVADAVASRHPESRRLALDRMAREGVHVVNVEMALFEWLGSAEDEAFKGVSALIR